MLSYWDTAVLGEEDDDVNQPHGHGVPEGYQNQDDLPVDLTTADPGVLLVCKKTAKMNGQDQEEPRGELACVPPISCHLTPVQEEIPSEERGQAGTQQRQSRMDSCIPTHWLNHSRALRVK